jgi:hypothetical protein
VRILLALSMIMILVSGQSLSAAGAICRHGTLQEHVAARQSHDLRIAAVAKGEEAAAAVNSKKVASADLRAIDAGTEGVTPLAFAIRLETTDRTGWKMADAAVPAGADVRPLLEPPTA